MAKYRYFLKSNQKGSSNVPISYGTYKQAKKQGYSTFKRKRK